MIPRGSRAIPIDVILWIFLFSTVPCRSQEDPSIASGPSTDSGQALGQPAASKQAGQTACDRRGSAKSDAEPGGELISIPIQNNSNFGIGPYDRIQNVLNIQPVIPIGISESWNLIIRWIAPIIWQPAPGTANLEVFGIEENTPS